MTMNSAPLLAFLQARYRQHQPRIIEQPNLAEAAVLMAITDEAQPQLILTQRARHLSSHQGEVAFPGGKRDPDDATLIATALREAEEEIALPAEQVQVVATLDQVVSRFGYLVTPVLAVVPPPPRISLKANPAELDAIFTVPLALFQQPPSRYFERGSIRVPSYDFQQFHIWGLTAM
ncbi:MAG: CoA pyrophosphatase, partial [Bacterioplanes sp.]|nr:CoA pyrophosphatase [Bacterioplanes sp.]